MTKINQPLQPNLSRVNIVRAWSVVLTAALFFFYIFIQMNLFNAINAELVNEFHFTPQQMGYLSAFYFYGNVLLLFPAGMLLDRFSVRYLLHTVFVISIIATYIFSTTSCFCMMNAARLAIGGVGAFSLLSAIKLASRWFEPRHMALVVGVVVTIAMIGGAVAQTPLALLTAKLGWRYAMQLVVFLGVILLALQILIIRDEPKGLEKHETKEHNMLEKIGFWRSLWMAITNRQNWLSGLYISLINLPLFIFGGIWGVPYLTQVHNLTPIEATEVTTMLFVGMMIGSPLAGEISDFLRLRKLPMIGGAILTIAALLIVMYSPTMPLWVEMGQFFFFGLVMGSQVIGYPVIAESNPHTITATATSLGSTLIVSAGMLIPIYSWLLGLASDHTVLNNVYTIADFTRANYLMLVGMIIALFSSFLIKETHCKPLSQQK